MDYNELRKKVDENHQEIQNFSDQILELRKDTITKWIDEEKSVRWNRETIAQRNNEIQTKINRLETTIRERELEIQKMIKAYIQDAYHLNEKAASIIYDQAYEDGHADGYWNVIDCADTYAEVVKNVLKTWVFKGW